MKVTTSTGFTAEVNDSIKDDYELIEALSELDDNPLAFPKVMKLVLGDQTEALKEHVREADGHVSTQRLTEEVKEIFEGQADLKK